MKQKEKNAVGCQYQLMNQNPNKNRTITNQTALHNKHVYLYNIIRDYDMDLKKNLSISEDKNDSIQLGSPRLIEFLLISLSIVQIFS